MSWSWDHLRHFLALAEEGRLSGAARQLEVSHTTVLRRVRAFERDLGTRLFDRTPRGYALTPAGERLRVEAVEVRAAIERASREIVGRDAEPRGEVTITTTDTIACTVLPSPLAELAARHPDLRFRIDMVNRLSDLDNREADIAIRTCREPPARLIGRHVGSVRFVACAAPRYVESTGLERFPTETGAHRFVVLDHRYAATPFHRWLEARLSPRSVRTTVSGFLPALAACRAGMGISVLPEYLLDEAPELVALPTEGTGISTNELWILSHAGLRDTERVRLVRQRLYEALSRRFRDGDARPADERERDDALATHR